MIRNPAAAADPTVCFSQRPQCTCLTSFGTRSTMLLISCMTLSHCQQLRYSFAILSSSESRFIFRGRGPPLALQRWCCPGRGSMLQIVDKVTHTHTHARPDSRSKEPTLTSWINSQRLPSRKAITCVNTDIHCKAPDGWLLCVLLCQCLRPREDGGR